ncbi:FKBP-type peptidyl-prolyl cis-trans isomerase [Flavobacterium sp. U410]
MKSKFYLLSMLWLSTLVLSCKSDDSSTIELRDRQEVYNENIAEIEEYLQNNYLDVNDFTVKSIENGESSIWSTLNDDSNPYRLRFKTVKNDTRETLYTDGRIDDDVNYKLYYIILNEGGGERPTSVDSTFVAYKGWNLENVMFDENKFGMWFTFPEIYSTDAISISGFRQILSEIKTQASVNIGDNGEVVHNDYGNIIVFIPSGLAYFNNVTTNISQYAPIAFQIKLYSRKDRDHEGDKVPSSLEDLNGNNDFFDDDTDGDTLPNFLDYDDDGDNVLTKNEVNLDSEGNLLLPFPTCINGTLPKYLDPSCN